MNTTKNILECIFVRNLIFLPIIGLVFGLGSYMLYIALTEMMDLLIPSLLFFGIGIHTIFSLYVREINEITKIGNMEKQAKKLRKLGTDVFVERTNSRLINQSSRGNTLYESNKIIKNKTVKFIVYQDASTDRKYIKYVPNIFYDADEAQAWSLSLTLEQYKSMTIEA